MDSGSNKQVVGEYGVELTENIDESVEALRDNYQTLRTSLAENADAFSISHAADNYEKIFRQLVDR